MTPREASVRRAVVGYLHSLGPAVCWRSNPATPYGQTGDPDLFVCVGGQLICIELKRPGWKPTPAWRETAQYRRLQAWSVAGSIVLVATSREPVEELMKMLIEGSRFGAQAARDQSNVVSLPETELGTNVQP